LAGSSIAIATAVAPPMAVGSAPALVASLAPKSATAAVAHRDLGKVHGIPGLTAMIAVLTGICGAAFGPWLPATADAIGSARAFQISETAGAFLSLAMILSAVLTVALAPLAIGLLL
jgi:putative effector of murein hydrolase